jgi:hypothetical protein
MANEIQALWDTGKNLYAVIRNQTSGFPWSTSGGTGAFGAFVSGAWPQYGISLVEQGVSRCYLGSVPAAMPAGVHSVDVREQANSTSGNLQTDPQVAQGELQWNGSIVVPQSDLSTSGQVGQFAPIRMARGVMIRNFPFKLVSATDHVTPLTSGVISGQIARDGAAFGPLQSGAFTEMGRGWYSLQAFTSGDLNANTAAVIFTGTQISGLATADQRDLSFVLQRTSGQ